MQEHVPDRELQEQHHPCEQENKELLGSAQLTSCTGGASGFLNSERDTGRENLASMEGRL